MQEGRHKRFKELYRPTSILSVIYKIFTKVISSNTEIVDLNQPKQAVFRKGDG